MKSDRRLIAIGIFLLIAFAIEGFYDGPAKGKNYIRKRLQSSSSAIDGAWKLVWAKYNGEVSDTSAVRQFKMFHDGIFSLIATDGNGKITYAGYGEFELAGSSYKETFMYHTNPDYVGGIDWQDYEVRGDTLYAKGFKKVIVKGKDVTKDFHIVEEKRIRVNANDNMNDFDIMGYLNHIIEE